MCKNMLVYFYVLTNGAYRSLCRIMSEKIKGLKSNVHDLNKLLKNRYIQYIQLMEGNHNEYIDITTGRV